MRRCATLIAVLFAANLAWGQSELTLEDIFTKAAYRSASFGPARWLDRGAGYTTVEISAAGGEEIVRYDTETGRRTVLVSASALIPSGGTSPLPIDDYFWSTDGKSLLVFTNAKKVWREKTRGDYWVLDLESGTLKEIGGDADAASLMFAKFSPDGRRVGYVSEHNLYVEDLATGQIIQLTDDGSTTLINGTFDWVYEEEFRLRDGWRWSPDGEHIAFWQLDASGIRDFLLIDNTDSLYSFVKPVQYPKAGTVNSAARVGVISSRGGPTVWFEPSDDLRNHYINRMDWAASSDTIFLQQLNRLQNHLEVILGDVATGAMTTVFEDRDDAWVDVRSDDMRWLSDGSYFTWVSERDGWRRIYVVSRDGSEIRALSPQGEDVIGEITVDEPSGSIYYTAAPGDPTRRYLYRVTIDGSRPAERITPDVPGTHAYQIAPGGKWAIHTFATFDAPEVIDLVRLPSHEASRVLLSNEGLLNRLAAVNMPSTEFFRVDIGEVALDGWMMKPADFDSSKKYPVLFHVYGEAANQTVRDTWFAQRGLWHRLLANQGIIVVSVDNRGTPAPRGRAWRKFGYGSIGYQSSADQAAAARRIRTWPFIDSTRVAVWGWSGGGTSTLNAMFRYPELYDVGISVAPVTDRRYYDTIYQERYMGLPQDNPEGYRLGSPIYYAEGLEGDLLLMHGTGDDNVHYQNSEALINKLIECGKLFSFMAYPNRTHSISEGKGTLRHVYETMTRYLTDKLGLEEPAVR